MSVSKIKYADPYRTVRQLNASAEKFFNAAATKGERALNQYKGFIYLGQAKRLEALILDEENNITLSKQVWREATEAFELALDRARTLDTKYEDQANRFLQKMKPRQSR